MTFQGPGGPDHRPEAEPEPIAYPEAPDPRPKETSARSRDPWTLILGIVGGALLGTGLTLGILGRVGIFEEPTPPTTPTLPPPPTLTVPPPVTAPPVPDIEDNTAALVAQRAVPSIVAVEASGFLGDSGGSGVVYGSDGFLITNHHVIDGASEVAVVFSDGARYPAEVVGSDPLTDIAILFVERPDVIPIGFGSSIGLTVGERAIAVGNPLALLGGPSVTSGIVSALDRSLDLEADTTLYGLIQTDAPITRGSSGGALLDASGRLIGITTAIAVSDVGAEGLGFAIPIDLVLGVANDLIEFGEVQHARLGIVAATAFAEEGEAQYPVGVLVEDVLADSAYQQGGGQVNDVVTAINGDPIATNNQLLTRLRMHRAGEAVVFDVLRTDGELEIKVTLGRLE
jgi:putative serine protease PepD